MMFAVEVCPLPTTGGATGVAVAALFLLVLGVIVARWTRASAGRVSFVAVVPLLLLGIGAVSAQSSSTSCDSSSVTTTSTTLAPLNQNLILEIDTSFATLGTDLVYELGLFGDVDVRVDWGDGSPDDDVSVAGPFAHTYATSGQYTITVSGSLTGLGGNASPLSGAEYLTAVTSFGDLGIESLAYAFYGSENLVNVPAVLPATVTDMSAMFRDASSFDQSLSSWDTANVTNMGMMFYYAFSFDQSLSSWDTTTVTDMSAMFYYASSFDQSLGAWDIGLVDNMGSMLDNSALSVANYDATLIGWEDGPKQNNVTLGALGLSFSSLGSDARLSLNCFSYWQFSGDSPAFVPSSIDGAQIVPMGC
ncbi:MAG: BspA family leucine-rich repeat surface protein [Actinomycetes bacterium]